MIEIRQNQRKPYNWELAWPTNTAVVHQKGFVLKKFWWFLLEYCRINKKHEKSTLSTPVNVIFSWIFRYAERKSCSIFWQNFRPGVFAVFFCNEMEFWYSFGSFQRGSITVGRMDINWPSYCTTDQRLCFCICENPVFSCRGSYSITGGYTGIHFILFLLWNIDCGYLLEPPQSVPTIYVLRKNKKTIWKLSFSQP